MLYGVTCTPPHMAKKTVGNAKIGVNLFARKGLSPDLLCLASPRGFELPDLAVEPWHGHGFLLRSEGCRIVCEVDL